MVAPVVGHQEGRHGGENPTRNFGPIWVGAIPPWLPRLWATKMVPR
ncbi:hypothetical protein [Prochlorothrix hollandica]|nr:hypothetical protein [Prochlorothrix hollandica]